MMRALVAGLSDQQIVIDNFIMVIRFFDNNHMPIDMNPDLWDNSYYVEEKSKER